MNTFHSFYLFVVCCCCRIAISLEENFRHILKTLCWDVKLFKCFDCFRSFHFFFFFVLLKCLRGSHIFFSIYRNAYYVPFFSTFFFNLTNGRIKINEKLGVILDLSRFSFLETQLWFDSALFFSLFWHVFGWLYSFFHSHFQHVSFVITCIINFSNI